MSGRHAAHVRYACRRNDCISYFQDTLSCATMQRRQEKWAIEKQSAFAATQQREPGARGVMPGFAGAITRPALSIAWRRRMIYDRLPANRAKMRGLGKIGVRAATCCMVLSYRWKRLTRTGASDGGTTRDN